MSAPLLWPDWPLKVEVLENGTYHGKQYSHLVVQTGDMHQLFKYTERIWREVARNNIQADESVYEHRSNPNFAAHHISKSDVRATGGTASALFEKPVSLELYKEKRKEFHASSLMKEISSRIGTRPTRKRFSSEHDGEFDYDKRWDIKSFSKSVRAEAPVKIVKINAELSFSAGVSAETINGYGCFLVFLIELLEAQGIMCELYVSHSGFNFASGPVEKTMYHLERTTLRVKSANQYLSTQSLLKAFSANFYRRSLFATIVSSAHALNLPANNNLGMPVSYGTCWEIKDKEIFIYSVPDLTEQHSIVDSLMKFLNPEPKSKEDNRSNDEIPF